MRSFIRKVRDEEWNLARIFKRLRQKNFFAYLLLHQGRYEEGWACLEARERYAPLETHLNCPRWQGEPLHGKSLLIGFEAGHGDMIQFCRYAALAKERGAVRVAVDFVIRD